jgi:NTP pyrophosphatase (non-canonical NTP hydrolase)
MIHDAGLIEQVLAEIAIAAKRYGPPASTHESYGVLCEEVAELLDAIRANDLPAVKAEALQVAAVALRLADCCSDEVFSKRSTK